MASFDDYVDFQIVLSTKKYIFSDETETKTPYTQYSTNQGFFIGENYNIKPLRIDNPEVTAATSWTTSSIFTYDELVSAVAASPGSGYGHIELYYYDSNPSLHNITGIEIEVTDGNKVILGSFEYIPT